MTGDEKSDDNDAEERDDNDADEHDDTDAEKTDNKQDERGDEDQDDDSGDDSDGDGSDPAPAEADDAEDLESAAHEDLEPAQYDPSETDATAFAPKLPWRLLAVGALVIVGVIGGYLYNEEVETSALRESIVGEYASGVEPDARRLRGFRQRLEELIIASADTPPETTVDAHLRFAAMHDARGLYLRIRAEDAGSSEAIAHGSSRMMPDAFTRCLGVAPTSLRGLFERSAFLDTTWPERLRDAHTRLRLRVIQDELRRHIRRDLPLFTQLLDADYFLLVLEQDDGAFDVFLWDLEHGQQLLKTRARASGLLVPVRIDLPGMPRGPRLRRQPHPVGAAECSIAGRLKALTHEEAMTFGSRMPEPEPAATDAADAGRADAAGADAAVPGTAVQDAAVRGASSDPAAGTRPEADVTSASGDPSRSAEVE